MKQRSKSASGDATPRGNCKNRPRRIHWCKAAPVRLPDDSLESRLHFRIGVDPDREGRQTADVLVMRFCEKRQQIVLHVVDVGLGAEDDIRQRPAKQRFGGVTDAKYETCRSSGNLFLRESVI